MTKRLECFSYFLFFPSFCLSRSSFVISIWLRLQSASGGTRGGSNWVQTEQNLEERDLSAQIKLYYDLHVPSLTPAPLLIALHGYGANKRQMMREARQMAPPNFAIAAMQGFHQHMKEPKEPGGPLRFGFGWLTNFHPEESVAIHHQAVLDLIETLTAERVADPQKHFPARLFPIVRAQLSFCFYTCRSLARRDRNLRRTARRLAN